ncbi:MAG: DegV family protein [Clostridiales bacterium]|nr:DegV family protein [Clostridiales bacterium]
MDKIAVVTDSNSGITQEEGEKLGIFVIPMPFTVDGVEYLEDISITQEKFFSLLENGADVTTSQPSQVYLEELWRKLLASYESIIYIPMTSGLSSTCENAIKLAEKFDGRVNVVDNLRISVPQKISVYETVNMVKDGKTVKEILEHLENTKGKCSIYITVSELKYLRKGGRITAATAALGDMFKLKPILYTRGQNFDKFAVAISMGQAKKKMMQQIKKELDTEFKCEYEQGKMALLVAYSKFREEGEKFAKEIEQEFSNMKVLYVDPLSLSVACHTGAGALGIGICVCDYL